jgi:hypothetical protein
MVPIRYSRQLLQLVGEVELHIQMLDRVAALVAEEVAEEMEQPQQTRDMSGASPLSPALEMHMEQVVAAVQELQEPPELCNLEVLVEWVLQVQFRVALYLELAAVEAVSIP